MKMSKLPLMTERLVIDCLSKTDREDYFHNISHDRKVLETFISRYAETLEEFDYEPLLNTSRSRENLLAIRLKDSGKLIGILSLFAENANSCEIGYGLGSSYWGKGYATEAVQELIGYLFETKGYQTIYASFFEGNKASERVMEKCGMIFDHTVLKELTYLGKERDLTYYAIRRK